MRHDIGVKAYVLAVLGACGGSHAAAPNSNAQVSNRAGAADARAPCVPPQTLTVNAKRRPNLDANDPDYGKWTPWHVILVRDAGGAVTVVMDGDQLHWTFTASGAYDCAHAKLFLSSHEPFNLELDVPSHRGAIKSIDDTWELY
jgi:hypothetical protein